MDRFPKMLYRFPGTNGDAVALQDGRYDVLLVDDDEAHDAALAEGWHESAVEARQASDDKLAAKLETEPAPALVPGENAPPTRAELEAKATELGIKFDGRSSSKKLSHQITDALKA